MSWWLHTNRKKASKNQEFGLHHVWCQVWITFFRYLFPHQHVRKAVSGDGTRVAVIHRLFKEWKLLSKAANSINKLQRGMQSSPCQGNSRPSYFSHFDSSNMLFNLKHTLFCNMGAKQKWSLMTGAVLSIFHDALAACKYLSPSWNADHVRQAHDFIRSERTAVPASAVPSNNRKGEEKGDSDRKSEREEKAVVITPPRLEFFHPRRCGA